MRLQLKWTVMLFFAALQLSFAQEKNVSGTVTDESGIPLPGVTILVKESTKGTQTDFDGNYQVSVQEGKTLVFSYVGMKSAEKKVGKSSVINVVLQTDAQELGDVIVVGYRELTKNEQTGSVVKVSSAELGKVAMPSVDQALQGKVAGLSISGSSGTPGSVQEIRIRGKGSINASNNPLYVIDGVPVIDQNPSVGNEVGSTFSPLSLINSNDVESITVLKDASATAAYGARGSNGVILITTKSGKRGDTRFTLSSKVGFQSFAIAPPKVLNAEQRFTLFNQAISGFDAAKRDALTKQYYGSWLDSGRPDTNWGDIVERNAPLLQDYNLTASGGGEGSTFYASIGYNSTEGVIIGSDFQRISAKFNYSKKLKESLNFSTNTSASVGEQNGISEQSAYFANPILARFFLSPTVPAYTKDGKANFNVGNLYNPLYVIPNDIRNSENVRIMNTSSLSYNILKELEFKSQISLDYLVKSQKTYWNPVYGEGERSHGYVYQYTGKDYSYVIQNSLNYKTLLAEKHNIGLTLLQEYQKYKYSYVSGEGKNIPEPGRTYIINTAGEYKSYADFEDSANAAYLGMLNYSYDQRYVVDLTYRLEGSSKFARGRRFGNFYSLGLAWNLHNEAFLSNANFLNELKLRASYGRSGNSDIGINKYVASVAMDGKYNANPAFYPDNYGNDDLTWEKNNSLDIGLDFSIFNNRLSGQVTYFNKQTYDLLAELPITYVSGYKDMLINNGRVQNKGFEVELSGKIIDTKNFTWTLSANVATLENKVLDLAKDTQGNYLTTTTSTRAINVGHAIYAWYMPVWAGVNKQNGNPQWYVNPDVNKDITEDYNKAKQVYVGGSALPTYTGGLSTNINFNNFFVSASLYFSGGNKVYEDWGRYTNANNQYSFLNFNGVEGLINSWTPTNTDTDWPKIFWDRTGNQAQSSSSRFLYDGDYIRLRNLQVGYTVPSKMLDKTGLSGLTLSLTATNLFTWVKDSRLKYDPEVRGDGFTNLTSPPTKNFTFNVNINF